MNMFLALRVRHPAAPPARHRSPAAPPARHRSHTPARRVIRIIPPSRSPAAPPARHRSHTPAHRVIRIIRIIRSYGHTAAWHCATCRACPASEPCRAQGRDSSTEVGIFAPRSGFRLRSTPRSVFRLRFSFRFCPKNPAEAMRWGSLPELGFIPKNPSPGQRRRSVSDAVLAVSLTECFFSPLTRPAVNPAVATGLLHPILLWQQDCSTQSCCGNRIAIVNPAVATGLLPPFLRWQQDCPGALRAARAWNCSCPSTGL